MSNTYISGAAATFNARKHTCSLIKLEAQFADGVDASLYFIQLHDTANNPAAAAVPVKVWPAMECAYKEFKRGELGFANGCTVVVSSTRLTYTAQATNVAQVQLEFSDVDVPLGSSYVGDLTTGVSTLTAWADGAVQYRLRGIEVKATAVGATSYLMVFANSTYTTGDKPLLQLTIPDSVVYTRDASAMFNFGFPGLPFKTKIGSTTYNGCYIAMSSTPTTYTAVGGIAFNIKVEYK